MTKKIMLDPGHAGDYYNPSPVADGYYESDMTWALAVKLKAALEKHGFELCGVIHLKNGDPRVAYEKLL